MFPNVVGVFLFEDGLGIYLCGEKEDIHLFTGSFLVKKMIFKCTNLGVRRYLNTLMSRCSLVSNTAYNWIIPIQSEGKGEPMPISPAPEVRIAISTAPKRPIISSKHIDYQLLENYKTFYQWRMDRKKHIDCLALISALVATNACGIIWYANHNYFVWIVIGLLISIIIHVGYVWWRLKYLSIIPMMLAHMQMSIIVSVRDMNQTDIESRAVIASVAFGTQWWYVILCEALTLLPIQILKAVMGLPLPHVKQITDVILQVVAGVIISYLLQNMFYELYKRETRLKSVLFKERRISKTLYDTDTMSFSIKMDHNIQTNRFDNPKFIFASSGCYKIFGIESESLTCTNNVDCIGNLMFGEDRVRFFSILLNSAQEMTKWDFEGRIRDGSGWGYCRIRATPPYRYNNMIIWDGYAQRCDKEKMYELRERKKIQLARVAEFERYLKHETRNRLQYLYSFIDNVVQNKIQLTSKSQALMLSLIQDIIRIQNDALHIEELFTGQYMGKPTPQNISHLMHTWIEHARMLAQEKNIQIEVVNLNSFGYGNIDLNIRTILYNLSSNAIKYCNKRISITCTKNPGHIRIIIKDDGPGIPEHIVNTMNTPWNRNDPVKEGSGLGLCITNAIANQIGGKLQFSINEGTEITIIIPYEHLEDDDSIEPTPRSGGDTHDIKILVIDDDKLCCVAAERLLNVKKCVCESTPNNALARDDLDTFDAIFIDHQLGNNVMDGIELTRQLRAVTLPKVVLIGQTANAESEYDNYIDAGAADVIGKPFCPKKVRRVMDIIERRKGWWESNRFQDIMCDMLQRIAVQLNSNDAPGLAHKMVGSAAQLNMTDLRATAIALETAENEQGFPVLGGNKLMLGVLKKYISVELE